jgi:hypothetical protein
MGKMVERTGWQVMRKLGITAIWLFCLALPLQSEINVNAEAVRRCIVFLYSADTRGQIDTNKPLGTGFLV